MLGVTKVARGSSFTIKVCTASVFIREDPEVAKNAMAFFGSTSPSYLILQSLDYANVYLDTYKETLAPFLEQVYTVKKALQEYGYSLSGNKQMKITIAAKPYGYSGTSLAEILVRQGVTPEFADSESLVLMLTPETGREGLEQLKTAVLRRYPLLPAVKGSTAMRLIAFAIMASRNAAL